MYKFIKYFVIILSIHFITIPFCLGASSAGKRIYFKNCTSCHGPNGKGAFPGVPSLTGSKGPLSKPDQILLRNIEKGFQSPGSHLSMPPKGGNPSLTKKQIRDVLRYMHNEFGSSR